MLKTLTPELVEARDLGITLFAGEAEEHFASFLRDVAAGAAKPIYNYMDDLPDMQGQTIPDLPLRIVQRYDGVMSSFDAGRGCPFQCSFCTIINVQGRKSRWRDADDVERILRQTQAGRLAVFHHRRQFRAQPELGEDPRSPDPPARAGRAELSVHGAGGHDCHRMPGFIEKAGRAGVKRVFIGLESINPASLAQ